MSSVLTVSLALILCVIHFLPSIVAFSREHPRRITLLVLNILVGWTLIGWIVLLIWAFARPSSNVHRPDTQQPYGKRQVASRSIFE
jgi:hypothetical protein